MRRLPRTVRWLAERARLSPTLLDQASVVDSLALRIRTLTAEHGWTDAEADARYAELLDSDASEAACARSTVAVPETWLFRGRASFELLRTWLTARRGAGHRGLSMLSAGCAGGAEPLSMVLTALAAGFEPHEVLVDAVDVNRRVLGETAGAALSGMVLRDGIPPWVSGLERQGERVRVAESAARAVRFVEADLLHWTAGADRYDVIFCRNVLIYLEPSARRDLVDGLCRALRRDGILVIGHAETSDVPRHFRPAGPLEAFAFERGEPVERASAEAPSDPSRRQVAQRASDVAAPERRPAGSRRRTVEECRELLGSGASEEVEHALRELIRREPLSAEAHCLLAHSLLRRERFAEAEESLRRAVYLDPRHEESLLALAGIAERTGRTAMAERYRLRALDAHLDGA